MSRSLTNKNFKVKRLHTRDRTRGYKAPTDADIVCPFFADKFFRLGEADVVDDMIGVCEDNKNSVPFCSYKEELIPGQLCTCSRYWKEDFHNFTPIQSEFEPTEDQFINVTYLYKRSFANKEATVTGTLYFKDPAVVDFLSTATWDDFPAYGAQVWSRINDKTIMSNANTSASRIVYEGEGADSLIDYEFNVKSYVDPAQTDGDYAGVVFHHTDRGYYLLDWSGKDQRTYGIRLSYIRIDPNTGATTTKQLHQSPSDQGYNWVHGAYYKYVVKLYNGLIECAIYRVDAAGYEISEVYSLSAPMVGNTYGTFGMYASSQQNLYFYDLQASGGLVVGDLAEPSLRKTIDLEYDGTYVSKTLKEIYQSTIKGIMDKYPELVLDRYVFNLVGYNTVEPLFFDEEGNLSADSLDKALKIASYDYEEIKQISFQLESGVDSIQILLREDMINDNDAVFISYHLKFSTSRIMDSYELQISQTKYENTRRVTVLQKDKTLNIPIIPGTEIFFIYRPKNVPMDLFTGPSIDTHQKIYKIRDNKLKWHPPARVGEKDYDDI